MTSTRSWTTLLGRLTGAIMLSALVIAWVAAPASARRNVNLSPSSSVSETPPAGESPPAGETSTTGSETPPPAEPAPVVRRSRRSSCGMTLEGPSDLSASEAVVLKGRLTCGEAAEAAGQQIQIFERTAGTPGFAEATTVLTESDGSFTATLASVEANSFFYARLGRSRSARVATRVTPLVTLAGPARGAVLEAARHASAQTPIRFSGTVSPNDAGAVVALQRERPLGSGRWRLVAATIVGDDGSFAFEHAFHAAGPLLLRAFLHSHAHRVAAVSETLSYEVASPQDAALTISASPQPLAFGESVTVSGMLAGPAGVTVTLQARSRDGVFGAVTSTTTTEGGAYTFTQTPTEDTDYRVTSGVQRSVAVHVQVAFALTATPSATTVASGEGVAMFGKIEPASPGARVYLQRLTPGGATWGTLGFATVRSDSTFEIDVPPATIGTASYRVRVASAPGLAGAVTQPVAVTTTAAGS